MLWLDTKYANLLSNQLDRFSIKKNNPYLANLRCPYCGDSQKFKNKARGYLYVSKNSLMYKCHNCNISKFFNNFLKDINNSMYDEYRLERFRESSNTVVRKAEPTLKFEQPKFRQRNALDDYYTTVNKLDEDHPCRIYCEKRLIPKEKLSALYYIDDFTDLALYYKIDTKKQKIKNRLGIPFIDYFGNINGISCRAIDDNPLRYYVGRFNKDPLIYGANTVDASQKIYVTEGPIDCMFLDNAVAVGNADLTKIAQHYDKDKVVLIFDNQPRNKEIKKFMLDAWYKNFNVVVWPNNIKEKDINEMTIAKHDVRKLLRINTFSGARLRLSIMNWSKV